MRYLLAFLFLAMPALAQDPCGRETPCQLSDGSYHVMLPDGWETAESLPAVVFFHGHNATGAMIFRSAGLRQSFVDRGYVVVAPNGTLIEGRQTRRWAGRSGAGRDDVAFTQSVLRDAAQRFRVDPSRQYAAGFSAGGSMVWLLACKIADTFSGYVSLSGALRQPNDTTDCPNAPVRFLHIHGFADTQVPLEGRAIGNWHQGSVWDSLALARKAGQCRTNPDRIRFSTDYRCRHWDNSCAEGAVRLCLRDGGHGLPSGWTNMARDWFEGG